VGESILNKMNLLSKLLFLVCLIAMLFTNVEAKTAAKKASNSKAKGKAQAKRSKKDEEEEEDEDDDDED
jgi:flagellar biosynthesis/type III secretory pathway M-ring protein FliF/YscJ